MRIQAKFKVNTPREYWSSTKFESKKWSAERAQLFSPAYHRHYTLDTVLHALQKYPAHKKIGENILQIMNFTYWLLHKNT